MTSSSLVLRGTTCANYGSLEESCPIPRSAISDRVSLNAKSSPRRAGEARLIPVYEPERVIRFPSRAAYLARRNAADFLAVAALVQTRRKVPKR
jgi:hypothetical protein